MNKIDLKENVQGLIVKVKTKEALELIKRFIKNSTHNYEQLENAVLMQLAALNGVGQQKMNGIISDDDYNRTIAKVNYATLGIANQIDEDDVSSFDTTSKPRGNSQLGQEKIKILFLSANPEKTSHLRLNKEIRYVKNGFTSATLRDKFEFISEPAVTVPDITKAIMTLRPQIVHFSGHGTGKEGLVVEAREGKMEYFSTTALSRLFGLFKDDIECTLLNACYSEEQAVAISKEGLTSANANKGIYAVGTNDAIGDKAAIDFSVGFYQAIGEGYDYKFAFEMGLVHVNAANAAKKPEIWFNGENITDVQ